MQIKNKTVIVTGAAGGIGSALVDGFVSEGAGKVVACDLPSERLNSMGARAPCIIGHALDVTDQSAVDHCANLFLEAEIIVNCHGLVVHEGYLAADNIAAFRKEMDVNYWGQVMMCRAFAPIVEANGGGAIINFLSPLAYVTFPFTAGYCATKAACRVLTEALRAELGPKGTLIMSVCPGTIDTGMMVNLNIPKSGPDTVATAVMQALKDGEVDVWAGEGAQDMKAMLEKDPEGLKAQAATMLTVDILNRS